MAEVFQLSSLFEDAGWESTYVSAFQRPSRFRELQSKGRTPHSVVRVDREGKSGFFSEGHNKSLKSTMKGQRQWRFKLKIRKKFWLWPKTGTGYPERLWDLHPWRCPKFNWQGLEQPAVTLKLALPWALISRGSLQPKLSCDCRNAESKRRHTFDILFIGGCNCDSFLPPKKCRSLDSVQAKHAWAGVAAVESQFYSTWTSLHRWTLRVTRRRKKMSPESKQFEAWTFKKELCSNRTIGTTLSSFSHHHPRAEKQRLAPKDPSFSFLWSSYFMGFPAPGPPILLQS